jgi:hypothetical protein
MGYSCPRILMPDNGRTAPVIRQALSMPTRS